MDRSYRCTDIKTMPKRSRPLGTRTPQRTPNGALDASNCTRPTFTLGRISLGASSDSSDRSRSPSVRSPLKARIGHRLDDLVHFGGQRTAGPHTQPGCMPPPPPRARSVAVEGQARAAYHHGSSPVLGASKGAVVDMNPLRDHGGDRDVRYGGHPAGGSRHDYGTDGYYQEHHHHYQSPGWSAQVRNDARRDSDGSRANSSSGTYFFSAPSTTPPQSPMRSPKGSDVYFSGFGLKRGSKRFPAAGRVGECYLHHSTSARSFHSPLELNVPEVHDENGSQPSGSPGRRGDYDCDDQENIKPGYVHSTVRGRYPSPSSDAAAAGRQMHPLAYHKHSPRMAEHVDHRRTPNISQEHLPITGSSSSSRPASTATCGTSSSLRAGRFHGFGSATAPAAAVYSRIKDSRTYADQAHQDDQFSLESKTPRYFARDTNSTGATATANSHPSSDDDDSNDEIVFEDCRGGGLDDEGDDADGGDSRDCLSDSSVSIEEIAPPTPARKNQKDINKSRRYVDDSDGSSEGSLAIDLVVPSETRCRVADAGGSKSGRYCDGDRKAECVWSQAAPGAGGAGTSPRWELEAKHRTGRSFSIPAKLYDRMYAHQREGVRWLWKLHQGEMGGILGDDMGLGKTFQASTKRTAWLLQSRLLEVLLTFDNRNSRSCHVHRKLYNPIRCIRFIPMQEAI